MFFGVHCQELLSLLQQLVVFTWSARVIWVNLGWARTKQKLFARHY
jgi:hypothetical protein